jgi:pyridinium-3,5-biscarboxylic acid mononucleotide sulfurtransferase
MCDGRRDKHQRAGSKGGSGIRHPAISIQTQYPISNTQYPVPNTQHPPITDKGAVGDKKAHLIDSLAKLDALLVAFSGGVDSAFLLAAAREALGKKVVAATAVSPLHPRREQEAAAAFARNRGIVHILFQTHEMTLPEFVANDAHRCYYCKAALSEKLLRLARERGIPHVAHGANTDDVNDYRPGLRAAEEAGIMAPLIEARLSKAEIRFLAKEMGLSEWDKPAMACLASRFPYGSPITEKGLRMVEAAEAFLSDQGFSGVRVRHHGSVARIEAPFAAMDGMTCTEKRQEIVERLRQIGFEHIALDLEGYVSGKMNRGIEGES